MSSYERFEVVFDQERPYMSVQWQDKCQKACWYVEKRCICNDISIKNSTCRRPHNPDRTISVQFVKFTESTYIEILADTQAIALIKPPFIRKNEIANTNKMNWVNVSILQPVLSW